MSSQPSIAKLRAEALEFGLQGEEALDFVYKQQEFYTNDRAAECATRAEEAEHVESEREAERAAQAAEAQCIDREKEAECAARAEERCQGTGVLLI